MKVIIHAPSASADSNSSCEVAAAVCVHRGRRVLIMDDERPVAVVLGQMLIELGYQVTLSTSGAEAVAAYRSALEESKPFAFVMLDVQTPDGFGGEEVMRRLRVLDPLVAGIVMSGNHHSAVMRHHHNYGFSFALKKPFRLTELETAVSSVGAS